MELLLKNVVINENQEVFKNGPRGSPIFVCNLKKITKYCDV